MGEPHNALHAEWFKRAEEDMLVTRHLLAEGMGHLTAAALLQQAEQLVALIIMKTPPTA
jgi:hypothetical protein